MNLPMDTTTTKFQASLPPKPVFEFGTKNQKLDPESGDPMFTLEVVVFSDSGAEVLPVKFAGQPPVGIKSGTELRLSGLVAWTWVMKDGSHGVSFKAARVEIAHGAPVKAAS